MNFDDENRVVGPLFQDTPVDEEVRRKAARKAPPKTNQGPGLGWTEMDDAQNYVNLDGDLGSGIAGRVITIISWVLMVLTVPLSLFFCFKVVQQYERAVIFRLGRLKPDVKHGIFFLLPCIESYRKVDTRSRVFDLPTQEVLTKESLPVTVDAVLYYRISNAILSVTNVANAHGSARLLAQTTLRGVLGQRNLQDILSDRDSISADLATALGNATETWGIVIERVEITDVKLPTQLQRAMAAEGEAVRDAKAKLIAAEGEQKAARALKEAAETLSESPAAMQLRYLQTLTTIAAENNRTAIFPLPVQLIADLIKESNRKVKKPKSIKKIEETINVQDWE